MLMSPELSGNAATKIGIPSERESNGSLSLKGSFTYSRTVTSTDVPACNRLIIPIALSTTTLIGPIPDS